jgi:hypothetical protein
MSSIALESSSGEPIVSLTLLQADGNSSLLTTEADLAARHWRKWLQSSRCHGGKLFRRQSMMDILCGAALSASTRGSSRYRPLWTDEALHRAACMLQLLLLKEERLQDCDTPLSLRGELVLAKQLHAHFRSLSIHPDHVVLPCESILDNLATLIIELFSSAAGTATFSVAAPGHQLAAFRRRAIALAAANLLMQTMLTALQSSVPGTTQAETPGNIRVSYDASGRMARLRVAHDGSYGVNVQQSKGFSVVRALADLLDGRLVCRANRKSGSIEIRFAA